MYMDNVIIEGLFQTNNQKSLPLSKEGSLKHYPRNAYDFYLKLFTQSKR